MKEISALTTVSEKEIGKCFQKMEKMEKNAAIEATDLLPRFCFHLGLSNDILRAATSLCVEIKNLGIAASKTPRTVAAAAIYSVTQISNNPKSPKVCGVHQRFFVLFVVPMPFPPFLLFRSCSGCGCRHEDDTQEHIQGFVRKGQGACA